MNVGMWKINYCIVERGFICEVWKGIVERKKLVKFNMIKIVILIFLIIINKFGNLIKKNELKNY